MQMLEQNYTKLPKFLVVFKNNNLVNRALLVE